MPARILVAAVSDGAATTLAEISDGEVALTHAPSLTDAVQQALSDPPDAILALVADDAGAAWVCELLRGLGETPLIVAGLRLSPATVTACLDRGADMALVLPVAGREFSARVQALLRRAARATVTTPQSNIAVGDLRINLDTYQVWRGGVEVELTQKEFQVLAILAATPGRVVSNRELLTRVWGPTFIDDLHYVRLYIGYLRGKIEADPRNPRIILNQWGVGYRLALPDTVAPGA
ncbi:MAG: response regulator transcription factor [Dehalococcoidia bacterium]